jgi:ATP-dependent RNA helicase DDX23/PRP28
MAIDAAPSANGNRTPLSVDDLLRKKKDDELAQAKPKFLTKAEREAAALQRRQAEVEKKREAVEAQRLRDSESGRARPTGPPAREEPRRYDGVPTGPKALRHDGRDGRDGRDYRGGRDDRDRRDSRDYRDRRGDGRGGRDDRNRPPPPEPTASSRGPAEDAAPSDLPIIDRELLQSRYLGAQTKDKRKIRKMSDKKFVFEWDKTEDTGGSEIDPLYRALLDGRKESKIERPRPRQEDL